MLWAQKKKKKKISYTTAMLYCNRHLIGPQKSESLFFIVMTLTARGKLGN